MPQATKKKIYEIDDLRPPLYAIQGHPGPPGEDRCE